jgi:hypothetical protein
MTTASTYRVPAAATPGANESGMQGAASCSVIGRGGVGDVGKCNGSPIGASIVGSPPAAPAWEFTLVPPTP